MKPPGETRPLDNDFTGETLYRRIERDWVARIRVDGSASRQHVTLPGTSFWRSDQVDENTLTSACPYGVYRMQADDLPNEVPGKTRDGVPDTTYAFRVVDDPQRDNAAHCQVWVFADGVPVLSGDPIPAGRQQKLRESLAAKLRRA